MGIESLLIFLLIGAIAGWLAGLIVSGFGFGLLGNIIIGILGAVIAAIFSPHWASASAAASLRPSCMRRSARSSSCF